MVVLSFLNQVLSSTWQSIFGKQKKFTRKTIAQYKQEILVNSGREQFQYLLKKNIRIPVVFL